MGKLEPGEEPQYKKKKQSAEEHRNRTQQHEEHIRAIASISTVIHGVIGEQRAANDQRERQEDGKRKREWTTIIAIGTTAVVALLTLFITHCDTLDVIHEARIASEQQHADTLAALNMAADANVQSRRMAQASENGQRAWIAPVSLKLANPDDAADPLGIKATFVNVGSTPALNVRHQTLSNFMPDPTLAPDEWKYLPKWQVNPHLRAKNICSGIATQPSDSVIYPKIPFTFTTHSVPKEREPIGHQSISNDELSRWSRLCGRNPSHA